MFRLPGAGAGDGTGEGTGEGAGTGVGEGLGPDPPQELGRPLHLL